MQGTAWSNRTQRALVPASQAMRSFGCWRMALRNAGTHLVAAEGGGTTQEYAA